MTRLNSLPKKYQKKAGSKKVYVPLESEEQKTLAQYLDMKKYLWCHVPNGGNRNEITGVKLKQEGVKPGVPDVLIFDNLNLPACPGIAIELKRQEGGRVSDSQKEWLADLRKRNWICYVAHGAMDAIEFLESLERGK